MDVRAQVSMVFHLDKCIGCHTCSIACKNIWTDRKGAEYMWWNNVETKPGTGYPTLWEDQERYRGGWHLNGDDLELRLQGKSWTLGNIFANPALPTVDDYYEPWTYDYEHLFDAPAGDDQPTARTVSMITGEPMDVEAGPNWDDDLGGSPIYAANDPNLDELSAEERAQLNELERMMFFYLPRICNHCVNPSCVAACPAGALYKRGEDGIVLLNQEKCRAWRMRISGCPYKKTYYNWASGKSEKCILCFPRLESGQAPACFHSCVGRIRYLGVLLYDASRLKEAATARDEDLVEAQRAMIMDPFDPEVIAAARANGVTDDMLEAARNSPVYRFVKMWRLALPLHPEFRTLPMLFYVPPMLPVMARLEGGNYEVDGAARNGNGQLPSFSNIDQARAPLKYLASMFTGGNEELVSEVYRKLLAVRVLMRSKSVGNVPEAEVTAALEAGATTAEEAEAIFLLTSKPTFQERFVLPPLARELQLEATENPFHRKQEAGFGFRQTGGAAVLSALQDAALTGRRSLAAAFAEVLAYPYDPPEAAALACADTSRGVDAEAARLLEEYASLVAETDHGTLQEHYTRTFDLDTLSRAEPTCYPYVGHYLFDESHKRGAFIVGLRKRFRAQGFADESDLADHLVVLLRFLAVCEDEELSDELVDDAFLPALARMAVAAGPDAAATEPTARTVRDAYLGVLRALELTLAAGRPAVPDVMELETEREWVRSGDSLGIDRTSCGH